jgi:hypothetical protein
MEGRIIGAPPEEFLRNIIGTKKRDHRAARRDFACGVALHQWPPGESHSGGGPVRTPRSSSNSLIFNNLFHDKRFH